MKRLDLIVAILLGVGSSGYFYSAKNKAVIEAEVAKATCQSRTVSLAQDVKDYVDGLLKEKKDSGQSKKISDLAAKVSTLQDQWNAVQVAQNSRKEQHEEVRELKAKVNGSVSKRLSKRDRQREREYEVLRRKIIADCKAEVGGGRPSSAAATTNRSRPTVKKSSDTPSAEGSEDDSQD